MITKTTSSEDKINKCTKGKMYFKYDLYKYCIPSNNSRPLINRLPQIIAPSQPSSPLLFLLSSPHQVEVEPDPTKLISDDSGSDIEDIDIANKSSNKLGILKKPLFSLFDFFLFNGIIKQTI